MENWTVARVLTWMTQDFTALGVSSPRLDAELLLCQVLACDRVRLYMDMPRPLQKSELDAMRALVQRRRKREPVAYILGQKEFYRHTFEVSSAVLVPRPETELLVDRALEVIPQQALPQEALPKQVLPNNIACALDLCTGSGAIAISLAAARESLHVDATELSPQAAAVATRNAERNGVQERVTVLHGDLFDPLPKERRYAVITANPPYVTDAEYAQLAPEITQHEPKLALTAGADGLDVLRRICEQAPDWLEPGGALLLEIGLGQASAVRELLERTQRFATITTHRDYGGVERVVQARLQGGAAAPLTCAASG